MEEGLKIILSADVKQLEEAFVRASTVSKKHVDQINATLSSFGAKATQAGATVAAGFKKVSDSANTAASSYAKFGGFVETVQAKLRARQEFLVNEKDINNIAKINREIQALEALLARVKRAGKSGFDEFGEPLRKLPTAADAGNRALGRFSKGANQADFALMNFSRVLQDAPYGIMGVANNLNPLAESFGRLKVSTGSTVGALKAMAGSLMGGGGIGLAIGAVSSLLVVFGDKLFKAKKETKEVSEELKETKRSLEEVAAEFAGDNIAKIELYRNALTNLKTPLAERNKILDDYNKLVDKQNELSKADLSNIGKINGAINAQIQLFQKRALVRAAEEEITKLYQEVFKAQFQLTKNVSGVGSVTKKTSQAFKDSKVDITNWSRAGQEANKVVTESPQWRFLSPDSAANLKDLTTGLTYAELAAAQLNSTVNLGGEAVGGNGFIRYKTDADKLIDTIGNAKAQIADLFKFINRQIETDGISVLGNFDKDTKTTAEKKLKELGPLKIDFVADSLAIPELEAIDFGLKFNPELANQKAGIEQVEAAMRAIQQISDSVGSNLGEDAGKAFSDKYNQKLQEAVGKGLKGDALSKFQANLAAQMTLDVKLQAAMENLGAGIATSLGEGLGQIFTGNIGDGIKQTLTSIFETLGTVIQQMGLELIKASAAVAAFKKALATLFKSPAAGLAVGIGLVAVGQIMKSVGARIPRFAEGGLVSGPTLGLMGEYPGASSNPEVIAPLSKLKDIIRGSGGGQFPEYLPAHSISGDNLLLWYQRANRSQGRTR